MIKNHFFLTIKRKFPNQTKLWEVLWVSTEKKWLTEPIWQVSSMKIHRNSVTSLTLLCMLLLTDWPNIAKFSIVMFLNRPFEVIWMENWTINSRTIHLIFFNFIFDFCSLFSRPPILRAWQGGCYFNVYCAICANIYFVSYRQYQKVSSRVQRLVQTNFR